MTIKELQQKIYNSYGIVLKEDDPAWLMVLIYNDLLKEVNKSIDDLHNMPKISQANEEILKALSTLQLKTSDLLSKAEEITSKVTVENLTFTDNIVEKIKGIKKVVEHSTKDAISGINIDTKKIENIIINKLTELDLSKVDKFIEQISEEIEDVNTEINTSIVDLKSSNTLLKKSIEELDRKSKTINKAVKEINSANKSVSMTMTVAMLSTGIVIGFGIATYFKIDALSNYYFSKYEKKQKLLERKIQSYSKLNKYLYENEIEIHFGKFSDTKKPFLSVDKDDTQQDINGRRTFTRNNGQVVIRLKTDKTIGL
jgi:hypothetical protein